MSLLDRIVRAHSALAGLLCVTVAGMILAGCDEEVHGAIITRERINGTWVYVGIERLHIDDYADGLREIQFQGQVVGTQNGRVWVGNVLVSGESYKARVGNDGCFAKLVFDGPSPPWTCLVTMDGFLVSIDAMEDPDDDWLYLFLRQESDGAMTGIPFNRVSK